MLPEALSSDACSLVPGVPRSAVTVELKLDGEAKVRSAAFYRSTIRSDARFTYEEVDRVFDGSERAPGSIAEPLALARSVAGQLRDARLRAAGSGSSPRSPSSTSTSRAT